MSYHHGDLRRALLDAAVAALTEHGPAALSLRDVARRVGVSHAASTHHFKDKAGLLTAVAVDGYRLLGESLSGAAAAGLKDLGVAYARFAVEHPGHFGVMFVPGLLHADDPDLTAARARTRAALRDGVAGRTAAAPDRDARIDGIAAWALMHGLATLWNAGSLGPEPGEDIETLARAVAGRLFADVGMPRPAPSVD